MLDSLFTEIGLNKNEQAVYLTVLEAGKIAPQRVARLTGINRTTVYSVARKLAELGLLSEDVGQKVTYLVAEDPQKLIAVYDREANLLAKRRVAAQKLAEELVTIPKKANYSVPRIKFVEERDLSDYLYAEYRRWSDSAVRVDNTWWGFQDHSFTEQYEKFIEWSWKESPAGLKVCFFANQGEIDHDFSKKFSARGVRPLPTGVEFDSSFWVAGDYIFMVQTRVRPHYLVEIYDVVLARNQRELFKGLWMMAK